MNKAERVQKIEALQDLRGSRVLTYLTADRGVAHALIAEDVLRVAYDHLRVLQRDGVEKLDLFLYSRGGDMMLPWPLVNTIRSLFPQFSVLVPFRAHSAATSISLGADEIVMTPIAQLTPVEPTIKTAFNPTDPSNQQQKLGINVEDAASYFEFAEERGKIDSQEGKSAVLTELTKEVHPLAIGHVHRMHQLASLQSQKLLGLHMDPEAERAQIEDISESLVTRLLAHEYRIGRVEARRLGLKAVDATPDEEAAIWDLFAGYEAAMELRTPITPTHSMFPAGDSRAELTDVKLVYVESTVQTDVFMTDLELTRTPTQTPPGSQQRWGPQVQLTTLRQAWTQE